MKQDRSAVEAAFRQVQDRITDGLSDADGSTFHEDNWQYERGQGGGRTRVLQDGNVIESGGVNFSAIAGDALPAAALKAGAPTGAFFATGVSLVIHPRNPYIPTIHMNIRYFEAGGSAWFGGGIDLTPYYPTDEDVRSFHAGVRTVSEQYKSGAYAGFKEHCDTYFTLPHRGEMRGVGGIFYDHLPADDRAFKLCTDLGNAFNDLYLPLVHKYKDHDYTDAQRQFQLYRRGRYVEFNLLWDRGTKFGIESEGRTESILMSMPPLAAWHYAWQPAAGSPEAAITARYYQPHDWL